MRCRFTKQALSSVFGIISAPVSLLRSPQSPETVRRGSLERGVKNRDRQLGSWSVTVTVQWTTDCLRRRLSGRSGLLNVQWIVVA